MSEPIYFCGTSACQEQTKRLAERIAALEAEKNLGFRPAPDGMTEVLLKALERTVRLRMELAMLTETAERLDAYPDHPDARRWLGEAAVKARALLTRDSL